MKPHSLQELWINGSPVSETTIGIGIENIAQGIIASKEALEVPICIVGILKGGLWTTYKVWEEVARCAGANKQLHDMYMGHVGMSSYGEDDHPTHLKGTYHLDIPKQYVQGSVVWVLDDIVDSGVTMARVMDEILDSNPLRVFSGALLEKKEKNARVSVDMVGIMIEEGDPFIVGCGMGYGEAYRSLPSLYEVVFTGENKCTE